MESNENPYEENDDLIITYDAMRFLKESGKWGQMLAIVGFVFLGLMVLASFFMGTFMSSLYGDAGGSLYGDAGGSFYGILLGIVYLVMAIIYFFPILYLYKFSTQIKSALNQNDSDLMATAFENMKSMYKFMGIFTIISIGLYFILGVGAFIFSAALF